MLCTFRLEHISSFFGGFIFLFVYQIVAFTRLFFYLGFILLFKLLEYLDISDKARQISSLVLALVIGLVKFLLWLLRAVVAPMSHFT
jgi:hypothetical protein